MLRNNEIKILNNFLNKKVDAAIIFWIDKFNKNKIPFGIFKIQKFLWYAQILSWYKDKKFIFGELKFVTGKYGPLNIYSWKKWRIFLNKFNLKNNFDWKKEISKKGNINYLTSSDKENLNIIFERKKESNAWELFWETHLQEPYIKARMLNNVSRYLAMSSCELKTKKISIKNIKEDCEKITENYILNKEIIQNKIMKKSELETKNFKNEIKNEDVQTNIKILGEISSFKKKLFADKKKSEKFKKNNKKKEIKAARKIMLFFLVGLVLFLSNILIAKTSFLWWQYLIISITIIFWLIFSMLFLIPFLLLLFKYLEKTLKIKSKK